MTFPRSTSGWASMTAKMRAASEAGFYSSAIMPVASNMTNIGYAVTAAGAPSRPRPWAVRGR